MIKINTSKSELSIGASGTSDVKKTLILPHTINVWLKQHAKFFKIISVFYL